MIETPSRILVVDDEPSITEFVSYALKKEGYETAVVDNGEDAFALASANKNAMPYAPASIVKYFCTLRNRAMTISTAKYAKKMINNPKPTAPYRK